MILRVHREKKKVHEKKIACRIINIIVIRIADMLRNGPTRSLSTLLNHYAQENDKLVKENCVTYYITLYEKGNGNVHIEAEAIFTYALFVIFQGQEMCLCTVLNKE